MSIRGKEITVLGAGIAGLAVALALARKGAHVQVLEQAEALREVGAGLQIGPNGVAVLEALGLPFRGVSLPAEAIELREGVRGGAVLRMPLAPRPYHFFHRADLVALIATAAEQAGVDIRLGQRVHEVDLAWARPRIVVNGQELRPSLLIGADGLHSKTHAALNGMVAPFFTRQVAWRAVIAGEGPGVAEVHMGPGRHLVSYPLTGGRRNLVAVEERNAWVEEGWSQRDDPAVLRAAFARFSPRVQGWLDQVEEVGLWGLFRHPVAKHWYRKMADGAAVILGDAAHPTLPFLAQGAVMGLEDAYLLANRMDRQPIAEALADWQALRAPRCARIVAAANGNARAYHLRGLARGVAHLGLRLGGALAPEAPLRRFDWLYGYDVTKV